MNVIGAYINHYCDALVTLTLVDKVQTLGDDVPILDDNGKDNERRREDATRWTCSHERLQRWT